MKQLALLLAVAAMAIPVAAEPTDLADELCSEPPCGYILPQMDIEVADKMLCGGGYLIYAEGPPEDCYAMLADGESRTFPATLKWFWEMSEDGTYPKETGTEIYITFSGTATNPDWLQATVSGEDMQDGAFVVTDADLASPDYIRVMPNAQGNDAVYYWYEKPIDITFTRSGEPSSQELKKLQDRHAVQTFFLKAKSSESGPRFKEAFAVEEFRFNACTDEAMAANIDKCPLSEETQSGDDVEAPGLPLVGALLILGVLARRR